MKLYQLVDHQTGIRSPLLSAESLEQIANRCRDAVKGSDNAALQDYVLVLCDELSDGQVVISRQPLMRISTILELLAAGHKEPPVLPALNEEMQ